MNTLYYIGAGNISYSVSETVISKYPITIEEMTFQRLSKPPRGRAIKRRLTSLADENLKIVIY